MMLPYANEYFSAESVAKVSDYGTIMDKQI